MKMLENFHQNFLNLLPTLDESEKSETPKTKPKAKKLVSILKTRDDFKAYIEEGP